MSHSTYALAAMTTSQPIALLLIEDSIAQVVFDLTQSFNVSAADLRFLIGQCK